jgi:SAM-dependent methyltransferase
VRKRVERLLREFVDSGALVTRRPRLMKVVDAVDRPVLRAFPEFRDLPPNHLRIRAGVGNRVFFNQAQFLEYGAAAVVDVLAAGVFNLRASVVDVGCGCGRFAHALARFGFAGRYTGIDVDAEAIAWCRAAYPSERFRFHHADVYSSVYNPGGRRDGSYRLPADDASEDLVLGQSLLTHLLEDAVRAYLAEAHRVLRSGGHVVMGVFCLEDMRERGALGGRWTFGRRLGNAYVQSDEYPEAAVAYERGFLDEVARSAGFGDVELVAGTPHTILRCRR